VDKLKLWILTAHCDDYKDLASCLASNYRLSKQIIVEALIDDDKAFSKEFLLRVFTAVNDGQVRKPIASFRYNLIAKLFRGKFERIAQETIAEYLLETLEMSSQNRDGSEYNWWLDREVDTHFDLKILSNKRK